MKWLPDLQRRNVDFGFFSEPAVLFILFVCFSVKIRSACTDRLGSTPENKKGDAETKGKRLNVPFVSAAFL